MATSAVQLSSRLTADERRFRYQHLTLIRTGWFVFGVYVLFMLFPQSWHASVRLIPFFLSGLWILAALSATRGQIKFSSAVWIALLSQAWCIVSYIHQYFWLNRATELGPQVFFFAGETVPAYCVTYLLCKLDPNAHDRIPKGIIWALAASAAIGLLQWLGTPIGNWFSKYYALQELGLGSTVRAQGLAGGLHPFSQHLIMLSALLGSYIFIRQPRARVFAAMIAVVPVLIATQGRTGLSILVLFWLVFLYCLFQISRPWALVVVALMAVSAFLFVATNTQRLYFLTNAIKQGTGTLQDRAQKGWRVATGAFLREPLFGVGPDAFLYRGRGTQLPDRFVPEPIVVESGYLFTLSQFGVPGLALLVVALLRGFWVSALMLFNRGSPGRVRQVSLVAFTMVVASILYFTIDNGLNQPGRNALVFLLLGWVSATLFRAAEERAKQPAQSPA